MPSNQGYSYKSSGTNDQVSIPLHLLIPDIGVNKQPSVNHIKPRSRIVTTSRNS